MSKFRTKFQRVASRFRSSLPSRTRSEFAPECDIRTIIQRHSLVPPVAPRYVDMLQFPDSVHGVLEFARKVAADFDSLPVKAREYFNYDSSALVEFLSNSANRDKAIELGLIVPATPSTPDTPNKE